MCRRGERGQMLILFAMCVPIGLALLMFLLDVWKMYYVHSANQRLADSVVRTINEIIRDGADAEIISEDDIPSSVTTYSLEELSAQYPSAQSLLAKLDSAIGVLRSGAGNVTIEQTFLVDGDENLYCRIEVSSTYRTIMKLASADDGNSIDNATATTTTVLKFEKEKNKVTGTFFESDPDKLTAQLLNAKAATKKAIINKLVNPLTEEQKRDRIEVLNGFLGNTVDSEDAEKNKSAVMSALLNVQDRFSDEEKGAILDAYLTGKLNEEQLNNPNVVANKTRALANAPDIDSTAAIKILTLVLQVQPNVSNITSIADSARIFYEDSTAAKMYRRITVQNLKTSNSVSVLNEGKIEAYI